MRASARGGGVLLFLHFFLSVCLLGNMASLPDTGLGGNRTAQFPGGCHCQGPLLYIIPRLFVPEEASWTSVASEGTVLEDICLDFFFAIGRTSLLYLFSHVFVEVSLWLVSVFVIFRPKSVALLLGHNTECDDF